MSSRRFIISLLLVWLLDSAPVSAETMMRSFWNSHYSMTNIAELFNTGATTLNGTARLIDAGGNLLGQSPLQIPAGGQRDLIVNSLPGFRPDAAGMLEIEFDQPEFFGRLVLYRFASNGDDLEIVTGLPFQDPVTGVSYVNFNTFQPTHNPADSAGLVYQWLQIYNPDLLQPQAFTITIHDQLGIAVHEVRRVTVPPHTRVDLAAGHQYPGQLVGVIDIVPDNGSAPYLAQLNRYSSNAAGAAIPTKFTYGIVLPARKSSGVPLIAPTSVGGDAENWVVITNVSDHAGGLQLRCANNSGTNIDDDYLTLEAHTQVHMLTNGELAPGESGIMQITPYDGIEIVAESTEYFRNAQNGSLTTGFSTAARVLSGTKNTGSYNTFVGQLNYVKLYNNSLTPLTAVVNVKDSDGALLGSRSVFLPASTGLDLGLHELPFAPAANTVGQVSVDLPLSGAVMTEFMRIRVLGGFQPGSTLVDAAASFAGK